MNIIEAMRAAQEGKHIKRKSWYRMYYIYYDGDYNQNIVFGRYPTEDLQSEIEHAFKSRKALAQHLDEWKVALALDDYLADDWEIMEARQ